MTINSADDAGIQFEVHRKAKHMWGDLTDDELDTIAGKHDELIGRLQTKYGINKEKAQEQAALR